jgi:hypothetical protein
MHRSLPLLLAAILVCPSLASSQATASTTTPGQVFPAEQQIAAAVLA